MHLLTNWILLATVAWSTWDSWSSCTKSCGEGRSERQRSCTGGSSCTGDGIETRICNSNSCPGEFYVLIWISTCLQMRPNGQPGNLGAVAPRAVGEENPAGNEHALAALAAQESWEQKDGVTPTAVQVYFISYICYIHLDQFLQDG